MRNITVLSMITLDGVVQAPGAPGEDPSGGFAHGGWVGPYGDEAGGRVVRQELDQPADYLLGRRTFEIWEDYWPHHADVWPRISEGTKHVFSATRTQTQWKNTVFLSGAEALHRLKASDGPDLQVWGSSDLVPLLLKEDLVDTLRLKVYPLVLGSGKRLFGEGLPRTFRLESTMTTTTGVVIAEYRRA